MSFNLIIPGANFSALGNPKVESYIAGLPVRNMQALYLMEDGAAGSTHAVITDSSGLGNHATLLAGSTIQKTAQGVTTAHSGAVFTGSTAGSVLTVTAVAAGTIEVGKALLGAGVINSPSITSQTSGTPGGAGTYQLNVATATLSSQAFGTRNDGFFARTPTLYNGSYSLVMVERNRSPLGGMPSAYYPTLHLPSATASGGGVNMSEAFGETLVNTAGSLLLNHDSSGTGSNAAEIGLLNRSTNAANTAWGNASSIRVQRATVGQPKDSWIASALSFNAASGEIILRSQGATSTFTAQAQAAQFIAGVGAGAHLFGFGRYTGASTYLGDFGMFGLWNTAKSVTELDALLTGAKARMALRGVAAL